MYPPLPSHTDPSKGLMDDVETPLVVIHGLLDELHQAELDDPNKLWLHSHMRQFLYMVARVYIERNRWCANRAYMMAFNNGYPMGGYLAAMMMDVIAAEERNEVKYLKKKGETGEWLPDMFGMMHFFTYSGMPVDEAASRVAKLYDKITNGEVLYMASTLSKKFSEEKNNGSEPFGLDHFAPQSAEEQQDFLEKLREDFPLSSPAMTGQRR